jgi:conjugative relaxase-like TrwC/TraI family protein
MLTISKPLSAGQAQNYHQKEFTAKEQNYWSQSGVIAGEWQGRLAAALGLAGAVSAEDFAKLSQGQNPGTNEQLVRQRASYEYRDVDGKTVKTMEHRAGWDATFSAPKSVSLTALVGGDERVREAHRDSVRMALEQLEHYTQARIGGNHPPETTGKFVAAKFEHDTARPVDGYVAPQLHTHAVIFNVTERENGQTRAIQPQSLFASQQFATAVYQSELTYRLRELGYEITVGRSGAPEIKGYTQEYLDASSPRSQQIREYLERTGHNGKEAAEIAAHSTRDRKEIHSPGEVMAAHRKLAAEFGHQAEAVVRAARERAQHQEKPANAHDRVRESLTFSRDKNFEREAEYATVMGINSASNMLTVEKSTGELADYDPRRLLGVNVYREVGHEFSVGDRIQFTAPDKSLGVANRDLAVIESIAPGGRISARRDDNRRIEFDPVEHRHFDHGYAITSHSAQGLTAERVLINADTGVHPDLLNSRFGYVAVSRASHEATVFTNDLNRLGQQFGTEVSKTSALGISHSSSVAQEIGIG